MNYQTVDSDWDLSDFVVTPSAAHTANPTHTSNYIEPEEVSTPSPAPSKSPSSTPTFWGRAKQLFNQVCSYVKETVQAVCSYAQQPKQEIQAQTCSESKPQVRTVVAYALCAGSLAIHWFLVHAIASSLILSLSAGLASACILALANKYHTWNSYVAAYACFTLTQNPIGLMVGYLATLMINSARIKMMGPTIITLVAAAVLLPLIPLPTFPLIGLFIIIGSIPYLRMRTVSSHGAIRTIVEVADAQTYLRNGLHLGGRVLVLVLLLSISPLMSGGASGILLTIFSMAALGMNVSESVTNGLTQAERKERDDKMQSILNPLKEKNNAVIALFSLALCLFGVGCGAGSTAKRFGLGEKTAHLLEVIIEGWCLKALILLGDIVPQRSSLSDIMLNMDSGYISQAGVSLLGISPAALIVTLVISILAFLALATLLKPCSIGPDTLIRERSVNIISVAVVSGLNPVTTAVALGVAFLIKRYLSEEASFTMPLVAVLGYKA